MDRCTTPRDIVLTLFATTALVGVALAGLAVGSTPAFGVAWAMVGVGLMVFLWSRYLRARAVVPLPASARTAAIVLWFGAAVMAWWHAGAGAAGMVFVVPIALELTRTRTSQVGESRATLEDIDQIGARDDGSA